ncbi:MAG: hypothetical protein QOC94_1894 [Actinoplanes sp.]|jgi:hypothetical protein|nr:hypothetical protein [Actinoplanes sp.]MDT5042623.1 hypothetical protein [Actinoplanes sp.]
MDIPKHVIVAKLRERGLNARADFVEKDLPDTIDTVRHSGLLATLNLRAEDLVETAPEPKV